MSTTAISLLPLGIRTKAQVPDVFAVRLPRCSATPQLTTPPGKPPSVFTPHEKEKPVAAEKKDDNCDEPGASHATPPGSQPHSTPSSGEKSSAAAAGSAREYAEQCRAKLAVLESVAAPHF